MVRRIYGMVLGILCVGLILGCGSSQETEDEASNLLTADEVKQTLRALPYRYKFRPVARPDGAYSAVAGTAFGRHGTVVNFGIAFGRSTQPVPVPRAGTDGVLGYRNTFAFTNDLQFRNANGKLITGPQFKTGAQWKEAIEISVQITDRLCKSATGEPCPI
jgi:hypothetical protein